MFPAHIYIERRNRLKTDIKSGILLFLGNAESPINYPDNHYAFRQDSSFLYFWGIDVARLAAIIDIDGNREILFGRERREEMMKYRIILLSFVFLVVVAGTLLVAGNGPVDQSSARKNAAKSVEQPSWECPIAAGIWYPTDGPIPEKPMRYYRVRCWPGCHTGSTYGKYPDKTLNDTPIWPTSTIDVHSTVSPKKE